MAVQGITIALGGVVGSFLAPNLTIAAAGVLGTATTLLIAHRALAPFTRSHVSRGAVRAGSRDCHGGPQFPR